MNMFLAQGVSRLGITVFVCLGAAMAQVQWTANNASPGPRRGATAAFDSLTKRVVMVGGMRDPNMSTLTNETWVLAGTTWTQAVTPAALLPRWRAASAFDEPRQRVVMFGGDNGGNFGDTWTFNTTTNTWLQVAPPTSPSARADHAMASDPIHGNVVLFGGRATGVLQADTWVWNGTTWTLLAPPVSPSAREAHRMAFDESMGMVVLFGGRGPLTALSDTWAFDGTTWIAVPGGTTLPAPRSDHSLAYDPARRRLVMFDGSTFAADTWELVGSTPATAVWRQQTQTGQPGGRVRHVSTTNPNGGIMVHGGQTPSTLSPKTTFVCQPAVPASVKAIGTGCAGSAGVPVLTADLPWADSVWTLRCTPVPATFALLYFDFNALVSPPVALPGMPGCLMQGNFGASTGVAIAGNTGTATVTVVNNPAVIGMHLDAQMFVVDPPANATGAILSNAVDSIVGSR